MKIMMTWQRDASRVPLRDLRTAFSGVLEALAEKGWDLDLSSVHVSLGKDPNEPCEASVEVRGIPGHPECCVCVECSEKRHPIIPGFEREVMPPRFIEQEVHLDIGVNIENVDSVPEEPYPGGIRPSIDEVLKTMDEAAIHEAGNPTEETYFTSLDPCLFNPEGLYVTGHTLDLGPGAEKTIIVEEVKAQFDRCIPVGQYALDNTHFFVTDHEGRRREYKDGKEVKAETMEERARLDMEEMVDREAFGMPSKIVDLESDPVPLKDWKLQKNPDGTVSWEAYFIPPGGDDRVYIHEGLECRCDGCLLGFHRLMMKLFPRTYTNKMFQLTSGIVVLLSENGNVLSFARPDDVLGGESKFYGLLNSIDPRTGEWKK